MGLLHANDVRDPAGCADCGIASSPLARVDTVIVFLFTWSNIIGVKVYKEDGYYCHDAFKKVETK